MISNYFYNSRQAPIKCNNTSLSIKLARCTETESIAMNSEVQEINNTRIKNQNTNEVGETNFTNKCRREVQILCS